jgi:hypothetical protein
MFVDCRRRDDYRGRYYSYRDRLNHDDCGRWGGRTVGGLSTALGTLFDALGLSACDCEASEKHCYTKRQGDGFHSVIHDDHNSFVSVRLGVKVAERENVIDDPVTMRLRPTLRVR